WRTDAAETLSSQAAGQTPGETGLTVLTVGNDTFTEPLDGSACCVRVWNAALDGSELLAESNSATPVRSSGLQGAWRRETSSDLNDTSGNARHFTAGGTLATDSDEPESIEEEEPPEPPAGFRVQTTWCTVTGDTAINTTDDRDSGQGDEWQAPTEGSTLVALVAVT